MVGRRVLSTVCDDIFVVFEDALSESLVLHRLVSSVWGDLFVALLPAW